MISRSTWLHLRIPFSLYLMPVFCFALATSPSPDWLNCAIAFVIIHFFLYPASNGYNSYFDKDEGSIGGLENPPPVNKELYYVSLVFDAIAIISGLIISWQFAVMLFIYGLVSKAYSHPYIRLKKNGLIAWLAAGIFQGGFTYLMVQMAVNNLQLSALLNNQTLLASALATCMIFGFYPMTQIYQHVEDSKRGDFTISYMLGIKGTFYFSAFWFAVAAIGFRFYFKYYIDPLVLWMFPIRRAEKCDIILSFYWFIPFILFLLPLLLYFFSWYLRVREDLAAADFHSTMKLNKIAAYSLILFFAVLAIYRFV